MDGVKTEAAETASEAAAEEEEPVGRGQKRKRKGKDKKSSQPVKSYTTRERAKAEAEVVAEVGASCTHVDMSHSSLGVRKAQLMDIDVLLSLFDIHRLCYMTAFPAVHTAMTNCPLAMMDF